MSFMQTLRSRTNQHLDRLQRARDRRVDAADNRAKESVATARTKADKEKARQKLKREKIAIDRELVEAKIATNKARAALAKAKKESGDVGVGEQIMRTYRAFTKPKRANRRSTTKKRVVRGK